MEKLGLLMSGGAFPFRPQSGVAHLSPSGWWGFPWHLVSGGGGADQCVRRVCLSIHADDACT